jgi:hypothetical protein
MAAFGVTHAHRIQNSRGKSIGIAITDDRKNKRRDRRGVCGLFGLSSRVT